MASASDIGEVVGDSANGCEHGNLGGEDGVAETAPDRYT
jgi:hypothetical protein